jgi:hypothetical protein
VGIFDVSDVRRDCFEAMDVMFIDEAIIDPIN